MAIGSTDRAEVELTAWAAGGRRRWPAPATFAGVVTIVAFTPDLREAVLALSLRAWEPVFPLVREAVAPFVYDSFYPLGWRERQARDLAAVLDDEPQNVAVAMDGHDPVGWVCTRLHPDDFMGEVYVLAVDPVHQRKGAARATGALIREFPGGRNADGDG